MWTNIGRCCLVPVRAPGRPTSPHICIVVVVVGGGGGGDGGDGGGSGDGVAICPVRSPVFMIEAMTCI